MNHIESLKQSFTRMKSGEIFVKNWIVPLIFLIWSSTLFIIFIVFLGLFIAKQPMTINDQFVMPNDPEYTATFMSTLIIMGSILVALILGFIISIAIKPKVWVYWMHDLDHQLMTYEVTSRYERLAGPNYLIVLNRMSKSIYETDSQSEIKEQMHRTLFWTLLEEPENLTVKNKNNQYKIVYYNQYKRQKRTYTIKIDQNMVISRFQETVSNSYSGSNINSFIIGKIENVNRLTRLPLDPLIGQAYAKMNY